MLDQSFLWVADRSVLLCIYDRVSNIKGAFMFYFHTFQKAEFVETKRPARS